MHLLDVGAGERLAHHPDHRHDARNRGLVAKLAAARSRRGEELVAVLAEELLVGGHERLAGLERRERVLARRLDPADQLDDRVRAGQDLVEAPLRASEDPTDLRPAPGRGRDRLGPLVEQRREGRPDRPVTEQADSEGIAHPSRAARSS